MVNLFFIFSPGACGSVFVFGTAAVRLFVRGVVGGGGGHVDLRLYFVLPNVYF